MECLTGTKHDCSCNSAGPIQLNDVYLLSTLTVIHMHEHPRLPPAQTYASLIQYTVTKSYTNPTESNLQTYELCVISEQTVGNLC